ncbi:MAG: formylglycine-generating enzyme family protein [Akkermansiaceae bacterium]|nr:formylglycine-generating enzyme family protein [Akkermansiaceae bacterium]
MGDQASPQVGSSAELPVHTVEVGAFHMAQYEVTKGLWDGVRQWGISHGYPDLVVGNASNPVKGANHPVYDIPWHDAVKWCNARSEKENLTPCYKVPPVSGQPATAVYRFGIRHDVACDWNAGGYRLPTEAEWEKAARGGLVGMNFPWGNTTSHSQANYYVVSSNGTTNNYSYDVSPTRGHHPAYAVNPGPSTCPIGSLGANGYGLYNMAGNVWEWCWDRYGPYTAESQTDPRGSATGSNRVFRGGSWSDSAPLLRCSFRVSSWPTTEGSNLGFRLARSAVP